MYLIEFYSNDKELLKGLVDINKTSGISNIGNLIKVNNLNINEIKNISDFLKNKNVKYTAYNCYSFNFKDWEKIKI